MGFFKKMHGALAVMAPFNDVADGKINPYDVTLPKWCSYDDGAAGMFFQMVKVNVTALNPLIALSMDNFSTRAKAAIFNAARVLEEKNFTIEQSASLVATQIFSYCKYHGGISSLTD